jgi:hypothetical protein
MAAHCADDANDRIQEQSLLVVRPHDDVGKPADETANDEPDDGVHGLRFRSAVQPRERPDQQAHDRWSPPPRLCGDERPLESPLFAGRC